MYEEAPGFRLGPRVELTKWTSYSPWCAVNPALEKAYCTKKKEMTRRLGAAGVNEQLLLHGTSFANSEAILRQNFRLDKVGAEGTESPHAWTRRELNPHTSYLVPQSSSPSELAVWPLVRMCQSSTTGGRAKA